MTTPGDYVVDVSVRPRVRGEAVTVSLPRSLREQSGGAEEAGPPLATARSLGPHDPRGPRVRRKRAGAASDIKMRPIKAKVKPAPAPPAPTAWPPPRSRADSALPRRSRPTSDTNLALVR